MEAQHRNLATIPYCRLVTALCTSPNAFLFAYLDVYQLQRIKNHPFGSRVSAHRCSNEIKGLSGIEVLSSGRP
jgi:hypothetical protein